MRIAYCVICVLMFTIGLMIAAPAQAESLRQTAPTPIPTPAVQGTITVQLANGTSGASVPSGLTVTLYALSAELDTVLSERTAQADASGQARFAGVDAAPGRVYAAGTDYRSVDYFGEPLYFQPGQINVTLPVTVYETGADPAAIRIERMHVILGVTPGAIHVDEILVVSNLSDRTFVDNTGAAMRIALPAGAKSLTFSDGALGERYMPAENGFVDTQAVYPGHSAHQMFFSFALPYNDKALDVIFPIVYPVQNLNVLLSEGGVKLSSAHLAPAGTRPTQSGTYLSYVGTGTMAAGQSVALRLEGAAQSAVAESAAPAPVAAIAGVIALAVCVGVAVWWRARLNKDADEDMTQDALLDEIAALDDAYAAGQIEEPAYRRTRAQLKAKLVKARD